ncbi:E6 protein [Bos taurus papillomavirus 16]|uniref:Protein E6 n=1 Tax=Bos taurus papillomavirus 16 TaxID=1887214 RepID=A0A1B2K1Z4_9PAPI|nr:E6 protein [Bos taurus papillomavirus 16]ANZ90231.1 E6 protein [Bos taurus papillomavirus 16]
MRASQTAWQAPIRVRMGKYVGLRNYKNQVSKPNCQMAQLPETIPGLLNFFNLEYHDLYLTCIFCNNLLTLDDCWHFEHASLSVIWRQGWPYGCCVGCCIQSAYLECLTFYEYSAEAEEVCDECESTLLELGVRCYGCFAYLTFTEKLEQQWNGELFHKVRGRWKGLCQHCRYAWAHTDFD